MEPEFVNIIVAGAVVVVINFIGVAFLFGKLTQRVTDLAANQDRRIARLEEWMDKWMSRT